jgi:hypothetical protein
MSRVLVRRGSSHAATAAAAVAEIEAAIHQPSMCAVLLFCSASYDLAAMGRAIRDTFSCPVIACTSAGNIGPAGYQRGGMVAASLGGDALDVRSYLISPLSECRERAAWAAAEARGALERAPSGRRAFGFLVVDAMALVEEALTAILCHALGGIPVVGGSAGDDLRFERTAVYWDGEFRSDAAVFTLFQTALPFTAFKAQHFAPTEKKLVITAATPERRLVRRIEGLPAADAYAESLGLSRQDLDLGVFSRNPLMLRVGSEHYVRSIREAHPDGSMTFYSAIEEGLVLTVSAALDPLQVLEERFRRIKGEIGPAALVIACDCVLRRLELEQVGRAEQVGNLLAANQALGFNTYGEQFGAVHVNQTLTAIALGTGACS